MISKKLVILLCSTFLVTGLAWGHAGQDFNEPSEEEKIKAKVEYGNQEFERRREEFKAALAFLHEFGPLDNALGRLYGQKGIDGHNIGSVLDTPEHIEEKLGKYLGDNIDKYTDGSWFFHGDKDGCWIGRNVNLSDADRKFVIKAASSYKLYKNPNKDDGLYDGGNTVYMYHDERGNFSW